MRRLEGLVDDETYATLLGEARRKGIPVEAVIAQAIREYLAREHTRILGIGNGSAEDRAFHVEQIHPHPHTDRAGRGSAPAGAEGGSGERVDEPLVCAPPAMLRFEREIDRAGIELDMMEREQEHLRLELERIRNDPSQSKTAERLSRQVDEKSYEIENFRAELDLLLTKRDEERARYMRKVH